MLIRKIEMEQYKELQELYRRLLDIHSQATRKNRASKLKKYLITDLKIIEERVDQAIYSFEKVFDITTPSPSNKETDEEKFNRQFEEWSGFSIDLQNKTMQELFEEIDEKAYSISCEASDTARKFKEEVKKMDIEEGC